MGKPGSRIKLSPVEQKAENIIVAGVKSNLSSLSGRVTEKNLQAIKTKVAKDALAAFPADQRETVKAAVQARIDQELQKQTAQKGR